MGVCIFTSTTSVPLSFSGKHCVIALLDRYGSLTCLCSDIDTRSYWWDLVNRNFSTLRNTMDLPPDRSLLWQI